MFLDISYKAVVLFLVLAVIHDSKCQNIHKSKIDGLSSVTKSSTFLRPRNAATAKIYNGDTKNKGRSFHLTHEADYWFNLNQVMNDGKIDRIDKLCVQGTWLVYDKRDFQANSKQAVGIVSGEKACVSLKKYGKVFSIQPITPLSSRNSDTLAFFPDRDFSGKVWPVDRNLGEGQMGSSPKVRSLITLGKQEWTIVPAEGKPICISPQSSAKFPVCFVSKVVDGIKIKTGRFLSIRKGCHGIDKKKRISIHFCMPYDSGKIQRIEDIAQRMQGRAVGVSDKAATDGDKSEDEPCPLGSGEDKIDAEGKALMEIRLNTDLLSDTILKWPSKAGDVWKLELLERTFDIVFSTCPNTLVPFKYLTLVREVFVFLLDRSWKTKKDNSSGKIDDEEWKSLNLHILQCNDIVAEHSYSDLAISQFRRVSSPSEMNSTLDEMLKFRENFDQVIETVWLVANHVAATCHHALGYVNDFWTNFINVFQKMYFNSVEKQWTDPGKWNNAYKFVLGGFGIENTYNKLGICATIAIDSIDNLDPFSRNVDVDSKLK